MGEHKTPKPTAPLALTLWDRMTILAVLNSARACQACGRMGQGPKDRDDGRRWARAWDAINLEEAPSEAAGQTESFMKAKETTKHYALDINHVETLMTIAIPHMIGQERTLSPIRDTLDDMRKALKE